MKPFVLHESPYIGILAIQSEDFSNSLGAILSGEDKFGKMPLRLLGGQMPCEF